MATSDAELIEEVRNFTGYTNTDNLSDADLQAIVEVGKEEIRADIGQPDFTFYQTGNNSTQSADRALFWFTCIGTKVRTGELGGIALTINDLEQGQANAETYNFWMSLFSMRMSATRTAHADNSGAASRSMERTDRSYSFDTP